MVLPADIQPLFYAATIFGCAPHAITADNDLLVTKRGTVYSILCLAFFFSACTYGVYLIAIETELEAKLLLLTGIRTVLAYVCLFVDATLTLVWNYKLRSAVAQLGVFDRATNFNVNSSSRRIRISCYVVLAIVMVFWVVVGYMTYCCEVRASLFNGVTYGLVNAALSMQLLKFVGLTFLVCQRFRQLGKLLLLPQDGKMMILDITQRQLRLQEVWWLHSCLSNAFELINSVYAAQLIIWVANFSLNTLSRIYTISENDDISILFKTRESLLVSAYVVCLLLIATVCHVTADQANQIGKIAFSPLSHITGRRNIGENNVEAATYFQLRKLHFYAGAGLIRIDLPLLLSIASGITTYLVMLHAANRENYDAEHQ